MDEEEMNENSRDIYNSTREEILNEIHTYREVFGAGQQAIADENHYLMKAHDDDIIFSSESLKEFIRLIQRQGIHNLYIYSVTDDLIGGGADPNDGVGENKGGYMNIFTREAGSNRKEFTWDEIQEKQGFFVIVRYSYAWENPTTANDPRINVKNGRHQYVKAIGTVNLFNKVTSNPAQIVNRTSNLMSVNTHTNGTLSAIIDSTQYDVRIRGFDTQGKYTGEFLPSSTSATNKTFLRGDGQWTNILQGPLQLLSVSDVVSSATAMAGLTIGSTTSNNIQIDVNEIMAQNNGATATLNIQLNGGSTNFGGPVYMSGNLIPNQADTITLGTTATWLNKVFTTNLFAKNISSTTMTTSSLTINGTEVKVNNIPSTNGATTQFWRGGGSNPPSWSNVLTGPYESSYQSGTWVQSLSKSAVTLTDKTSGYGGWICGPTKNGRIAISTYPSNNDILYIGYNTRTVINAGTNEFARSLTWDGSTGYLTATRVYNAVFNDYAECRTTIDLEPGRVVIDNDDGSLSCSSQRLQPGAQIISDTFGNLMGETEEAKTPLAVAGRVLVYTYQPRENYHAGMAVCSAPDGTVDIMTREEIREYPDCIVGIVSEIPQYETWGTNEVQVNGRIWIKVK